MIRSLLGFDWSDEGYTVALAYRLAMGDAAFKLSWDIHQFSALSMVPLVRLYYVVFGSADGILLFLRLLYNLLKLLAALLCYNSFKKNMAIGGVLCVSVLVMFTPFSIFSVTYNSVPLLCFICAYAITSNADAHTPFKLCFAGALTGLGVQSYPLSIVVLPIFVLLLFMIKNPKIKSIRAVLWYALGGFLVILCFCVLLMINSSFENLTQNLSYLFTDPEHQNIGFSLRAYISGIYHALGQVYCLGVLAVTLLSAVLLICPSGSYKKHVKYVLSFCMAGLFVYLTVNKAAHPTTELTSHALVCAASMLAPAVFFLAACRLHKSIVLYFIGVALSLAISASSNNGFVGYAYPYVLSLAAMLTYMFSYTQSNEHSARAHLLTACSVALVGLILVSNMAYVYRDSAFHMDTRLTDGPARGIYTTKESAQKYGETLHAIDTYVPKGSRVLYIQLLPFAYLYNDVLPASPRLWRTNLSYPLFEEYYSQNPQTQPDVIYIANEGYGISNLAPELSEFYRQYIERHTKEVITLKAATIILLD